MTAEPTPDLAAALAAQRASVAELESLAALRAELSREWQLGNPGTAPVPSEIVHGTRNQWEVWMRLMGETPPRHPIAFFPDFAGLASIVIDNLDQFAGAQAALGFSIRTITVASALADPVSRAQVAVFASAGIEVRTMGSVPSWFYVDAGVLAALPLAWGEAVPTSLALVREPALVAALAAYANELWARATQVDAGTVGSVDRDAVLTLLAQGLSDGAIAAAVGQSVRTVRRRISDAAEAVGVTSRFELGMEWARRSH